MCGIAGIYNLNDEIIAPSILKSMIKIQKHRGPDDEGFYINNNIGLGHARLAIIDLSVAGHQPMTNENGDLWITYNGEIYNFLELRFELKKLGHVFRSNTDTEVIIHAYEQWGKECLHKFNGMWAFAIWNNQTKELFCARDRFGVKPFYYFFDGKQFAFASEIKALLCCPFIKKEPNDEVIYNYLLYNRLDYSDQTFFCNIKQLRQGHYLHFQKNLLELNKYYIFVFNSQVGQFRETVAKEVGQKFIDLLKDSVKLRLQSDVPVGSCLSGGLDSSTIVCLINQLLRENGANNKQIGARQKTFSACFEDPKIDERKYIESIIQYTGAESHYVFPSGEKLWQEINDLIWYQEEPFGSTSIYAQWNVMRLAKQNKATVLLDGQGGDETLAGYPGYFISYLNQLFFEGRLATLLQELFSQKKTLVFSINQIKRLFSKFGYRLPLKLRALSEYYQKKALKVMNPFFLKQYQSKKISRTRSWYRLNLQQELWESGMNSGLQTLFKYEDKNSMAFSLETLVPFVDYRLVEFVFSLPACYKIHRGWSKYLLRVGAKNLLPTKIRWRKDKLGFATPENMWLCNNKEGIEQIFKSTHFKAKNYLNPQSILTNLDSYLSHPNSESSILWRSINLELWLQKFF